MLIFSVAKYLYRKISDFMKKNNSPFNDKNILSTVAIIACFMVVLGLVFWVVNSNEGLVNLSFSDFVRATESKTISEAVIKTDNSVDGLLKDGNIFTSRIAVTDSLLNKLVTNDVNVSFEEPRKYDWLSNLLIALVLLSLLALFFYYLVSYIFRMNGSGGSNAGGGRMFSGSRQRFRFYPADSVKTKFDDVAGFAEVKDELKDVVDFLSDPEKYRRIGAKIPRGVLLSGAPGNGKTMFAKAIAGEANTPFISTSGSDFIELYVGVGASRVRELFEHAKRHAPCLVFIDEIDTIGKKRQSSPNGGADERDQTLNQLLTEMDGFSTKAGDVIVIAATNREDMLDDALTRPGRFDRKVNVPYPDVKTREEILKIHAKGVQMNAGIDYAVVARGTPGFSGADLANLINEAALNAVKDGRDKVAIKDLEKAQDKLILGLSNKSMVRTKEELRETAYHEAGHSLMNLLMPDSDPFHKVTIVAHGHALGVSVSLPENDLHSRNEKSLFARIVVALGGWVAEKLVLPSTTSGVSSDLNTATKIATNMVYLYGMSKLGPINFAAQVDSYGNKVYSGDTAKKIDLEVHEILAAAKDVAINLMTENIDKLHRLAAALLEKETLEAAEVYSLLEITPRNIRSFAPDAEVSKEEVTEEKSEN